MKKKDKKDVKKKVKLDRSSKSKISNKKLREILLKAYVDDDYRKKSDRAVWKNSEFQEATGMFQIDSFTGERRMLSLGSVSYRKKKLKLMPIDIYNHYYRKGNISVNFDEWKQDLGAKETNYESKLFNRKLGLLKEFNLKDEIYRSYTLTELEEAIISILDDILGKGSGGIALKQYYNKNK